MREAHAHLAQLGRSLSMVDLAAVRDLDGLLDRVASAHSPTSTSADWILGHGLRVESFRDPQWPTRTQLDAVTGAAPCCCWSFDYHSMVCNSAALRATGLDALPQIEGGVIETDADGSPTGLLLERAALRLWDAVPEPDESQRIEHLRSALAHLKQLGFDEVHDLKSQTWLGPALAKFERDGELELEVELFPLIEDLGEALRTRSFWESSRVRLRGGKLFVDGTLNARTAWMTEPFADGHPDRPAGMAMVTPAQIEDAVQICNDSGVILACHAIGDMAVRAVLDAIDRVQPTLPGYRIEHAELIATDDVARFVELGVVASLQPCHLLADIEALQRAVPNRLDRVLPIADLIAAGCVPGRTDGPGVLFGSDVPIVRADAEDSILAATERGRGDGVRIGAGQAISRDVALACFGGR